MTRKTEPIVVQVRRGGSTESSHQVHAVVADARQRMSSWGQADRATMPRSAIKSIQVLPLIMSGAAEAFDVSDDEIALASSSHGAEQAHVSSVQLWLDRIGLDGSALECGPADPITPAAALSLHRSGAEPTALHNCCSGKHAGFLTIAQHRSTDRAYRLPGYLTLEHGVQQQVRDAQAAVTGVDLRQQRPVIDGCGIPVFAFPLAALAHAMARMVTPDSLPHEFRDAAARVVDVLPSRSFLVSGTGRAEQLLTDAATEPVILKGGAEGVFMGALPARGIGFALKCEDGSTRGVDEAMAALLHHLGVTNERLAIASPLRNRAGTEVGDTAVIL